MKALQIAISGRVQGVSYRASTRDEALRRGVHGWVRNLPDGRVEAWIEGDDEAVDAMLRWCRSGPPHARVDAIDVNTVEPAGHRGFEIGRTR